MADFEYMGLTFTPYRKMKSEESKMLYMYMGQPMPKNLTKDYDYESFYETANKADKHNAKINLFICEVLLFWEFF